MGRDTTPYPLPRQAHTPRQVAPPPPGLPVRHLLTASPVYGLPSRVSYTPFGQGRFPVLRLVQPAKAVGAPYVRGRLVEQLHELECFSHMSFMRNTLLPFSGSPLEEWVWREHSLGMGVVRGSHAVKGCGIELGEYPGGDGVGAGDGGRAESGVGIAANHREAVEFHPALDHTRGEWAAVRANEAEGCEGLQNGWIADECAILGGQLSTKHFI